jgi:hypothetical protein
LFQNAPSLDDGAFSFDCNIQSACQAEAVSLKARGRKLQGRDKAASARGEALESFPERPPNRAADCGRNLAVVFAGNYPCLAHNGSGASSMSFSGPIVTFEAGKFSSGTLGR